MNLKGNVSFGDFHHIKSWQFGFVDSQEPIKKPLISNSGVCLEFTIS